MNNQKKETRSSLATGERASAKKQNNLTTYAAVVIAALAFYAFISFGLGHVFGVI